MVKMTHQGYQSKTVERTVSARHATADDGDQLTVVIEMLSPLSVLASQEV